MPYYVYRIQQAAGSPVKELTKLAEFEQYREARDHARSLRARQAPDDRSIIKVMFAATELQAEEQLLEKREAPILREWEK